MKKFLLMLLGCSMMFSQVGYGNNNILEIEKRESEEIEMKERKIVASDGARIQRNNPTMPTRVLKKGTRINMHFGDTVIPGILNDSITARAFIEMLPLTVHESRYSHDFCGSMGEYLPFDKEDERYGWLNGDIAIGTNIPWFTILFDDEEISEQYGNLVNIGVIDCELSKISNLNGSYNVLIELAE